MPPREGERIRCIARAKRDVVKVLEIVEEVLRVLRVLRLPRVLGSSVSSGHPLIAYINYSLYVRPVTTPLVRSAPLFAALADQTRLAIVDRLRRGERCVTDLCEETGAGQSLISFHLKALREVGLVSSRREGRTVWYALDASGLARLARLVRLLRGEKQNREEASRAAELEICMEYINDH
jgi:ArsR family transcriptional regulator